MKTFFTLFGATGDLAQTKLYPALYDLFLAHELPNDFQFLGVARSERSDEDFRAMVKQSLTGKPFDRMEEFLELVSYRAFDYDDSMCLASAMNDMSADLDDVFVIYLAIPPQGFSKVTHCIDALKNQYDRCNVRVVIEKPFGEDLQTARDLNELLQKSFHESEIYRIDHYLGKETVQNILALRFGNSIFEPLLNNRYVESIEISVLEEKGIGSRAAYFDQTGIVKDILQNHILQVMALLMMEPPAKMEAEYIRDEKQKVLTSLAPINCQDVSVGQYIAADGVVGYLDEEGVDPNSQTETYVDMTAYVNNLRWEGVPVQIRTGKRMPEKKAEIRVKFKPSFKYFMNQDEQCNPQQNELVIEIQPNEEVYNLVNAKFPGRGMCIQPVKQQFTYQDSFGVKTQEAYTRLLRDAMLGDQKLFIRSDEIEAAWEYVTPLIDQKVDGKRDLILYPAGTDPKQN